MNTPEETHVKLSKVDQMTALLAQLVVAYPMPFQIYHNKDSVFHIDEATGDLMLASIVDLNAEKLYVGIHESRKVKDEDITDKDILQYEMSTKELLFQKWLTGVKSELLNEVYKQFAIKIVNQDN